MKCFINY